MGEKLNSQEHYTRQDIEPIEYLLYLGVLEDFCIGNVIKYCARYKHKDGIKDLKKAQQYLEWLIEYKETGGITLPKGKVYGSRSDTVDRGYNIERLGEILRDAFRGLHTSSESLQREESSGNRESITSKM